MTVTRHVQRGQMAQPGKCSLDRRRGHGTAGTGRLVGTVCVRWSVAWKPPAGGMGRGATGARGHRGRMDGRGRGMDGVLEGYKA